MTAVAVAWASSCALLRWRGDGEKACVKRDGVTTPASAAVLKGNTHRAAAACAEALLRVQVARPHLRHRTPKLLLRATERSPRAEREAQAAHAGTHAGGSMKPRRRMRCLLALGNWRLHSRCTPLLLWMRSKCHFLLCTCWISRNATRAPRTEAGSPASRRMCASTAAACWGWPVEEASATRVAAKRGVATCEGGSDAGEETHHLRNGTAHVSGCVRRGSWAVRVRDHVSERAKCAGARLAAGAHAARGRIPRGGRLRAASQRRRLSSSEPARAPASCEA